MSIQVMKQALEALETCTEGDYSTGHVIHPSFDEKAVTDAITALHAAIEAAEKQEPVAKWDETRGVADRLGLAKIADETLLYTTPQPAIPAGMVLVPVAWGRDDGTHITNAEHNELLYHDNWAQGFDTAFYTTPQPAIPAWQPIETARIMYTRSETIKQLIELVRLQHEAVRQYATMMPLWKAGVEALEAFNKFEQGGK